MGNSKGQGRKPQPTALKVLKGNPGRRPLNEDEPKPEVLLPRPPAHLSPVARREWRRAGASPRGDGAYDEPGRRGAGRVLRGLCAAGVDAEKAAAGSTACSW